MTHQIETERLLLRRWRSSDVAPFAEICSDAAVMQWIGSGAIPSHDQCAKAIQYFEGEWEAKGYGLFAVERKHNRELAGFTGLSYPGFLPEILPAVEIGWRLKRECWGRGLATEAAKAALHFGLNDLQLSRIVSVIQVGNEGSQRIMEKLGMTFERETVDPSCDRKIKVYEIKAAATVAY